MSDEEKPFVLDIGTAVTKAGFGGKGAPDAVFPTVVGKPNKVQVLHGAMQGTDRYTGADAYAKQALLQLIPPVQNSLPVLGRVESGPSHRQEFEAVIEHALHLCGLTDGEGHPVLDRPVVLSESWQTSESLRSDIAQVLFETFKAPSVWFGLSSSLALFASGRTTGSVLEMGEGHTTCIPFLEGYALPRSRWTKSDVNGFAQNDFFRRLVMEAGSDLSSFRNKSNESLMYYFRDMKEKFSSVSESEYSSAGQMPDEMQRIYTLPDGGELVLGHERFEVGELLFNPRLMWMGGITHRVPPAAHECVMESLRQCDDELQPKLARNIVVCGGVSLTRGFDVRLESELNQWLNTTERGQAHRKTIGGRISLPSRSTAEGATLCKQVWKGASLFSALPSFSKLLVSYTDYREDGRRFYLKHELAPPHADIRR